MGFAGGADVAAVKQEPVVRLRDKLRGNESGQHPLGMEYGLTVRGETEAFAHAEDMCIHRHRGTVPQHRHHYVRGLTTDARQGDERRFVARDLTLMTFGELLRHRDEVLRLSVRVTDGMDEREDLFDRRLRHGGGIGVSGEEGGRDHIHALVRTLRREDDRHDEFERIAVMQFALSYGHIHLKPFKNRRYLHRSY